MKPINNWVQNPKVKGSGIIACIPQAGLCPHGCEDCFFQSGRSYLEPLKENLPYVPLVGISIGRVVKMNDGNDSNIERDLVEKTAERYENVFFNTASPHRLGGYPAPVVFTVNMGKMTDTGFHKLKKIPDNLMFVRVRVNSWNVSDVVIPAVEYYTEKGVVVVLTYMAYYTATIPPIYIEDYKWKKRTLNSYYVLREERQEGIEGLFNRDPIVYSCGYKGQYACTFCGNCIREYYNTMERLVGNNPRIAYPK